MQRISKANSVLSIALLVLVFAFGPTLFLLHLIPESIGTYLQTFVPMSTFMDASSVGSLSTWADSWNGAWSVFIFCWCFAFSPFVASVIASISRGRTLREFVLGIIGTVSYTHLDVYKRQHRRRSGAHPAAFAFLEKTIRP